MVQLIEKDLTQSTIVLGHTGVSRINPDYYAITVMNYILGAGGFSSRLMDSIRDKQGLAYGIMSQFDSRVMPGAFFISLQTRTDVTNQAITSVLAEIKTIREAPVTDQELQRRKSLHRRQLSAAHRFERQVGQRSRPGGAVQPWLRTHFTSYPKSYRKVTKDDVLRVAKQYLDPQHYALVVVGSDCEGQVKQ